MPMPVKRSLKLEDSAKSRDIPTPSKKKQMLDKIFSPTTGTCQLSPCISPSKENERRRKLSSAAENTSSHPLEAGRPSREQTQKDVLDDFMVLHSRAEKSLASFIKMRTNLKSLKALEGSKELETILGVSDRSLDLKSELRRTKELIAEVKKVKVTRLRNTKPL
ncbi:centromere protein R isoform X1 [Pleurodeles waltl]|uniref:centromere protein R isoform X1 n=1 Tax=Pleurodeles waltl TaxID=8319 RepID=UPI00370984A3